MTAYKTFVFVEGTYGLDDYISTMYDELTKQFDEKAQKKGYFEDQSFVLIIGGVDEKIYTSSKYEDFYFLDVGLAFPPVAFTYECTICWKKDEKGIPKFFWTSNFPMAELEEYVKKHKR